MRNVESVVCHVIRLVVEVVERERVEEGSGTMEKA